MVGPCCFTSRSRQKKQRDRWRMHRGVGGHRAASEPPPPAENETMAGSIGEARGPARGRGRASAHKAAQSASDSWRWTEHLARAVADEILIGQRDLAIHVVDRDLGGDAREPQPRAGPNVPQHPRSLVAPGVVLDSDTSRRYE
jgi:hypothetical protein